MDLQRKNFIRLVAHPMSYAFSTSTGKSLCLCEDLVNRVLAANLGVTENEVAALNNQESRNL